MTSSIGATIAGIFLSFAMAGAQAAPTPLSLKKIDTTVGTGSQAVTGSTVTLHYTGWLLAPKQKEQHGPQFDSSRAGKPFTFKLGTGAVIKGWDEGIRGMRAGGKRTLIVPADMAFGKKGMGSVPPTANLIFDIDLISVK
ncbi:MAG: FKBP-type peptidyl-prolyl cis-trans isomerase [Massilia sp.]